MVKFLLVRFSSIGDIVLTTPVIRHLKKQVEDAQIHFLTKKSYASLLDANPYVDKVYAFDGDMKSCLRTLKQEEYDYIIDLHHNIRTARIKLGPQENGLLGQKTECPEMALCEFPREPASRHSYGGQKPGYHKTFYGRTGQGGT